LAGDIEGMPLLGISAMEVGLMGVAKDPTSIGLFPIDGKKQFYDLFVEFI